MGGDFKGKGETSKVERTFLWLAVPALALLGLSASLLFPSSGLILKNVTMKAGEGELVVGAEEMTITGTLALSQGKLVIELSEMTAKKFSMDGATKIKADQLRARGVSMIVDPSKLENRGMGSFLLLLIERGENVEVKELRVKGTELKAERLYTREILLKGMKL
ncbi:MAG: hypothetical protein DSO02_02980 [Hadesarchaea archaeon]|nr:MAG: hypothetical protein DSO03_02935 [Hadesarchaea archaeon]TDA34071.1 MAG: hypothetical protein DSO02_02980 [Hadesarchaea archaeon]